MSYIHTFCLAMIMFREIVYIGSVLTIHGINNSSYCLLIKFLTMIHSSRSYKYASYEEFRDLGMFSSEPNCMQYLIDMKILRTHQQCPLCQSSMSLKECPTSTTSYREGCCWKCSGSCGRTTAPRTGSILQNSNITYEEFIVVTL